MGIPKTLFATMIKNANNTTYQQLLRLLTHCNEHQLQILLATATALLQPVTDSIENDTK